MEPTLTPLLARGDAKRINAWLEEGGCVCVSVRACGGRQEGERRRVLLCHHGNTSPCLPWTPLQTSPRPSDKNANSRKIQQQDHKDLFFPPQIVPDIFFASVTRQSYLVPCLCGGKMWALIRFWIKETSHSKETGNHNEADFEARTAPQSKVFWTLQKFHSGPHTSSSPWPLWSKWQQEEPQSPGKYIDIFTCKYSGGIIIFIFFTAGEPLFSFCFPNLKKAEEAFSWQQNGNTCGTSLGVHLFLYLSCNVLHYLC